MFPAFVPFALFFIMYIAVYFNNLFSIFHPRKRGSWNRVFASLGIPYQVKSGNSAIFLLPAAGIVVDAVGLFSGSPLQSMVLELVGSFAFLAFVVAHVPLPFPPREITLPYPRMGRAEFEGPEGAIPRHETSEIDVSGIRLFYVSNRNAHFFSLPDSDTNLTDTFAMFLDQSKPGFAWIQFVYERANVHQALEYVKYGLVRDKLAYTGKHPAWFSHADILIKKVNEGLASELFAVSVRGLLIGADPMNISLSFSDEVDSLAVFETVDPNLLYAIAKRRMPELKIPNYFGSRRETPFFLSRDLAKIVTPPTRGNIQVAPAGVEPITPWEAKATNDLFEAVPVPAIEAPFHYPPSGILELVYDGSLHVMFGGALGQAIKSVGVSTEDYDPVPAFASRISLLNHP